MWAECAGCCYTFQLNKSKKSKLVTFYYCLVCGNPLLTVAEKKSDLPSLRPFDRSVEKRLEKTMKQIEKALNEDSDSFREEKQKQPKKWKINNRGKISLKRGKKSTKRAK